MNTVLVERIADPVVYPSIFEACLRVNVPVTLDRFKGSFRVHYLKAVISDLLVLWPGCRLPAELFVDCRRLLK